jgi:hypothetical protein
VRKCVAHCLDLWCIFGIFWIIWRWGFLGNFWADMVLIFG